MKCWKRWDSNLGVAMRALGVDPGTVVTGFGLVDEEDNHLFHVTSGNINPPQKGDMGRRLHWIYTEINKLIQSYEPDTVIIEKGFYSRNVQTVVKLAQVNGIIMLAATNAAIPVFEYTPLAIKLAVVGYGAATKEQVQHMVGQILKIDKSIDSHHAADAIAAAICHLHRKVAVLK